MTIPLLLAKLWSVIPKLFAWPTVQNLAGAIERLSLLLLVGSVLVEFATGILDIENYYPLGIDFYPVHYYGAWVFGTAFVLHALRQAAEGAPGLPRARRAQAPARRADDTSPSRPSPTRARARRSRGAHD